MGWLRELMSSAEPPVTGYGELARRTLQHPDWPDDTRPQPRSLAALFSKLDRSQELEWLAERDAVQRALALTLGCSLEAVRGPLEAVLETPETRRLRLEDLPFARPFDFLEEQLPPGIPELATRPSAWNRTWWLAPSGSGRTLTGRWLATRGLAVHVCARTWAEAAAKLPEAGATFVELERADSLPSFEARPLRADVLIAAPALPPSPPDGSKREPWRVIESPSPEQFLSPLLEWVQARLPEDGAFDAAAARDWLEGPLGEGLLPSLGALLGVCGLLDAQGLRACKDKSLLELAAAFVHERLEQASGKGSAEAQWLKHAGFNVLVQLAEEVLTRGEQPWDVARTQDEWIALVPADLRDKGPGAYRIVRALADARLLRARGAQGGLAIAPSFLRHAALRRAREQLVREASPFSWGEALLRPHAAAGILEALDARLAEDDFILAESLFDLELSAQPALVAAAEAVFVCLGLQVLDGAKVPRDYLTQIWNEQLSWIVDLEGEAELPKPRLLCWEGSSRASILANPLVWSLAALAISERLGAAQGGRHAVLRPWAQELTNPKLLRLLDAIHACLLRPEIACFEWSVRAFALIGRLYNTAPGKHDVSNVHALAKPAFVVRQFLNDRQTVAVELLGPHALEARALRHEGETRAVDWPQLAEAAWRDWRRRGCSPAAEGWFAPNSPCSELLWPHLPPDVLDAVWSRWGDEPWPLHRWGSVQWLAFAERWPRQYPRHPASPNWALALERLDEPSLERVLGDNQLWGAGAPLSPRLSAILWRRAPRGMLAQLLTRIEAHDADSVGRCLSGAPPEVDPELLPALSNALAQRTVRRQVLEETRRWISRRVETRSPHWREAYALFATLEERVARSVRARGSLPAAVAEPRDGKRDPVNKGV